MRCTNNVFKTLGLLLLMAMFPLWAMAQDVTVKGVVSTRDGPAIGATGKVKGAQNGVITDLDGN